MSENKTPSTEKVYIKKQRETLIGVDSKRPQASKGFGSPKGVVTEKSDNFGASWKKLLDYAKPQMPAIIVAISARVITSPSPLS